MWTLVAVVGGFINLVSIAFYFYFKKTSNGDYDTVSRFLEGVSLLVTMTTGSFMVPVSSLVLFSTPVAGFFGVVTVVSFYQMFLNMRDEVL